MINGKQIHVCRDVNLRIYAPLAFLVRVKDAVAITAFRGSKLILITKINVTSYREEKLFP
jgi:hypothetical protein